MASKAREIGSIKVKPKKERINLESHEWYRAKFLKAEVNEGSNGDYVRLQFECLSGVCEDGVTKAKGQYVSCMASLDMSVGSKMYAFASGIMGYEPAEKDEVDLRSFYGETFEVNVITEAKKGTENVYSNVVKIRQPKKSSKKGSGVKDKTRSSTASSKKAKVESPPERRKKKGTKKGKK